MSKPINPKRARALFRATYHGDTNPLTPDVLEYGMVQGKLAYELAKGEGIQTRPNGALRSLYGVTVLEDCGGPQGQRRGDLNRGFETLEDARAYIQDGFRKIEASVETREEQAREAEAEHLFLCATNEGDYYPAWCAMARSGNATSKSEWVRVMRNYVLRLHKEKRIDSLPGVAVLALATAKVHDYYIQHVREGS